MAESSMEEESQAPVTIEKVLEAANLVKLGMAPELRKVLKALPKDGSVNHKDAEGRSFLHFAAAYGFESCIDVLLEEPGIDVGATDGKDLLPLHYAAVHARPMCAYNLAKAAPQMCLQEDSAGQTPADAAAECDKGEVLNAMLLACASISSDDAVASMAKLLEAGAVPDTWAPNGSSALMLAASVDCTESLSLLVEHGATIELQDALGRTALMFAAGSSAGSAVKVLLDAGASLAARDRRNKGILDYAGDDTPVRALLEERMDILEAAAEKLQAALLASLEDEKPGSTQQQAKAKRKKDKKARRSLKAAVQCEPPKHASSQLESCAIIPAASASGCLPVHSDGETNQQQATSSDVPVQQEDGIATVAGEGASKEDARATTADACSRQTRSSSGESEQHDGAAFGLADELTSEDEWKVVGKAARKVAPKTPLASKAAAPAAQQHKHGQQQLQKACKRCPSLASLTESSGTAESTESDHSVLSVVTTQHQGVHHKPQTPTGRPRAAVIVPSHAGNQRASVSRSLSHPEVYGGCAALSSSAAGQTWAGRVVGKQPARVSATATSAPESAGASSNAHLYNFCSSRTHGQQTEFPTIPEESMASASLKSLAMVHGTMYNRASNQSCCAAARAQSQASAAEAVAAMQEASTLTAELQLLRAAVQRTKTAHQQEIAQLLQSAALHQAQLVREAVQAEKDAMAERLLHTFQSMKGLMHARPFDERCNDASKDMMAILLEPQPVMEPVTLGLASTSQPPRNGYAAFVRDAGHQVEHDAAAATLGASLSGLVSGLSISAPFLTKAHTTPVLPHAAAVAAPNGSRITESFSFFST